MTAKPRQTHSSEAIPAQDPYNVINSFCQSYQLPECEAQIWELLSAAFSSHDADSWDAITRGNAVFFCRNIDTLIKATYQINQQQHDN
jgi:hypothetical protein